jgi:antitoxin YqcF
MSKAPETARAAARAAAEAFGGKPAVREYLNEAEDRAIDILSCPDRPAPGYTCYSTVTLHLAENTLEGKDIRVELAAVVESSATAMANLLASSAMNVREDGWLAAPGVVFPGLVAEYELSSTLEHIMWMEPFAFEQLASVDLGDDISAHWLMAMPISEGERRLLIAEGYDALENRFEESSVEYYDLGRESLV